MNFLKNVAIGKNTDPTARLEVKAATGQTALSIVNTGFLFNVNNIGRVVALYDDAGLDSTWGHTFAAPAGATRAFSVGTAGLTGSLLEIRTSGSFDIGHLASAVSKFGGDGVDKFHITGDVVQKLGINTAAPITALHVSAPIESEGSGTPIAIVESSIGGTRTWLSAAAGYANQLEFLTNGTMKSKIHVTAAGTAIHFADAWSFRNIANIERIGISSGGVTTIDSGVSKWFFTNPALYPNAPTYATGTLTMGAPNDGDTVTINGRVYTYTDGFGWYNPDDIIPYATFDECIANDPSAIVSATPIMTGFTVTALTIGSAGNAITTTNSPVVPLTFHWNNATLTGGTDAPNIGILGTNEVGKVIANNLQATALAGTGTRVASVSPDGTLSVTALDASAVITGAGTADFMTKWTTPASIGNSTWKNVGNDILPAVPTTLAFDVSTSPTPSDTTSITLMDASNVYYTFTYDAGAGMFDDPWSSTNWAELFAQINANAFAYYTVYIADVVYFTIKPGLLITSSSFILTLPAAESYTLNGNAFASAGPNTANIALANVGSTYNRATVYASGMSFLDGSAAGMISLTGKVLTSDSQGNITLQPTGAILGTGTDNYLPKWTGGGLSLTDSLISDDGINVTVSSLAGTGDRMVESSGTGVVSATRTIISTYGVPNTEKLKLEEPTNWSVNGVYTGPTITGTYQGQKHYDDNYLYEAVGDNVFIRLIRG